MKSVQGQAAICANVPLLRRRPKIVLLVTKNRHCARSSSTGAMPLLMSDLDVNRDRDRRDRRGRETHVTGRINLQRRTNRPVQ